MNFRFRHLRYFIAVAEEQHFRRAAERLGIAQPAISRAIRDLETDLGVVLFERSNKKVEITPAGQRFLKDCKNIWRSLENAVTDVRLVSEGRAGALRVGYTDMAISGRLPGLLKEFQDREPGIVLRPHMDPTIYQLERLRNDELDIAFVTGPIKESGLEQLPIQSEKFVCIVYSSHPLAKRESVRLEELANEDFVLGPAKEWEHFQAYLFPMCRQAGFIPKVTQEAYDTSGIIGLIACGMGLTVHTEGVRRFLRTDVTMVPLSDPHEPLMTVAVWKRNHRSGPVDRFLDFIGERKLPDST
ncbi:LysR family transcriptional regulator [Fluviibacterium sp. DFM31]|uniref:LysR family transcriptional regulator n=1 Tax=Meridianimarinicoccus marinus TaxID=3231483 RepID=A0ABV3LBC7_9RHOB